MAHDAYDKSGKALHSVADKSSGVIHNVWDGTKNTASSIAEGTANAASNVAEGTKNLASAGVEKTGQAWEGSFTSKTKLHWKLYKSNSHSFMFWKIGIFISWDVISVLQRAKQIFG